MGKVSRRAAPHRDPTVCSRRRGGGSAGTRGEGGLQWVPGHGRRQWPAHLRHQLRQASRLEGVHRDGGTRECSRYFGRGRSSTAAQGTRSVVRGPSFCWCMRRGHVLVCLESGDWRGGMKGEFLHPSLTATNDVPPQPCIKKAQPIEGRDTHSLRGGGREEHWPCCGGNS